jgi:hypothetical protein
LDKDLKTQQKMMHKLTQETGIVKNKFLKHDFINRKKAIELLRNEKGKLTVRSLENLRKHPRSDQRFQK